MKLSTSRIYAQILFKKASEVKNEENILCVLQEVCDLLIKTPLLLKFFKTPLIPTKKKLDFIKTYPIVYNFLDFLISRDEISSLPEIFEFYKNQFDKQTDREKIQIASFEEVTQEKQLEIKKYFLKKADIHFTIDPSLLEGFRIYWKGNILPISSKDFLKSIKETLTNNSI